MVCMCASTLALHCHTHTTLDNFYFCTSPCPEQLAATPGYREQDTLQLGSDLLLENTGFSCTAAAGGCWCPVEESCTMAQQLL